MATKKNTNKTPYTPPRYILERYAKVLVHFALNSGEGIREGETVVVSANEAAKPLYAEVLHTIWKAGGHVIQNYTPTNDSRFAFDRTFYDCAGEHQLSHFPKNYLKGLVQDTDSSIFIIAETDKKSLQRVEPEKIMKRQHVMKQYRDWRDKKENEGKFTWTLGLYGTPQMAQEAGLSERAYWDQIIKGCFLDEKDPVQKWKQVHKKMSTLIDKLNALPIEKVHVKGEDVDLWVTIGEKRKWMGGSGRNIPSFEIFTSPDWRGTEGWIRFNQPLYRYGNLIDGVALEFKNGTVVKSSAKKNEKVLKSMIASPNADKVGEFSLTDSRLSHISKFMAETLYDENMGGDYGNTHIALGAAYQDCYDGDSSSVKKAQWKQLGFNDSPIHTDIVSTTDRTVTAYLKDGTQKVIYKHGKFTL